MSHLTIAELPPPPPNKTGWPWTEGSSRLPDMMANGSSWPRISIVTPSYNQGQFIEETIRSILLQGYPNLEYIVIDGDSSDNSVDIIRKYKPWLAYWVSEKDKGQTDAINKGWRQSSGKWIAYLNSDDTLEPNTLHRVADAFLRHPTDFVYGSCYLTDEHSQILKKWHPPQVEVARLAFGNVFAQQTVFFRRDMLNQLGYLDEQFHFVMDYEYWLRAILHGATFQRILPPALANFRQWAEAKSWSQYQRFQQDRFTMIKKHFPDPLASDLARIAWAGAKYDAAWFEYAAGQPQSALEYWRESFKLFPKSYLTYHWQSYLLMLAKILIWSRIKKRS